MAPAAPPASGRSADLWSDLLLACLVIFVVLAPSYFFRVPERIERPNLGPPMSSKKAQ